MSYHQALGATLTKEQTTALFDISPQEFASLPIDRRVELAIRHAELQVRRKEAFWTAVQGFALGVLPLLAFIGIRRER